MRCDFVALPFSGEVYLPCNVDTACIQEAEQFFSGKVLECWGSKYWSADTSAPQSDMPLVVDVQEEVKSFVFTANVPGVARTDVTVLCCLPPLGWLCTLRVLSAEFGQISAKTPSRHELLLYASAP